MKSIKTGGFLLLFCYLIQLSLSSYFEAPHTVLKKIKFPYKTAGLSEREATIHLLNRFSFGYTPRQIDDVAQEGLEEWFAKQLQASFPDDSLKLKLSQYDALGLSNSEIVDIYPRGGREVRMAIRDGVINKDSVDKQIDKKAYKAVLDLSLIHI